MHTTIVAFFAVVILGNVFYYNGDIGFATAHAGNIVENGLSWIFYHIARFLGLIGIAGASLLVYIIDVDTVNEILGSPVIDVMWTIVRDILNLAFILILLFSAFATIFQVDRYGLRNTLVKLIIMALLVNFSLPIAKVIIDASNIIMYFFLNNLFPQAADGSGFEIVKIFGKSINIADVFIPHKQKGEVPVMYSLSAMVFAFFYGVSMMMLAGLLLVRLVALVLLMILSPIGFVASILPSTQSFAQKWWDNLFKYAFSGPILVFALFFSMSFMAYTHDMAFNKDSDNRIIKVTDTAAVGAAQSSNLTNLVFLMIPIVVLWAGIGMANTASDGASQLVTNFGRGMVGKAGRGLRKGGRYMAVGSAKAIPGAATAVGFARSFKVSAQRRQQRFEDKANYVAQKESARRAIVDRASVKTQAFTRGVAEAEKKLREMGMTVSQLQEEMKNGATKERRVAAARLAAQKGGITSVRHMEQAMKAISSAPTEGLREDYEKEVQRAVRKGGRRDVVTQYRINNIDRENAMNRREGREEITENQIVRQEFAIGVEDFGSQRSFDALSDDVRNTLREHVDEHIIRDAHDVRSAGKFGNVEVLSEVSSKMAEGVTPESNIGDSGDRRGRRQEIRDRLRREREARRS